MQILTSASFEAEPWLKSAKRLSCLVTLPAGETIKKVEAEQPRTSTDPSLYSAFTLPSDRIKDLTCLQSMTSKRDAPKGFPVAQQMPAEKYRGCRV